MNTLSLVEELKSSGEDFEFYPTTKEMIRAIYTRFRINISRIQSVLDIGCGTCNFKRYLEPLLSSDSGNPYYNGFPKYYVMEKSKTLINMLPKDAIVIGTDFNCNTLLDKPVDAIFSNPPYSEYVNWTARIIRESQAKYIFLVIPRRWSENEQIQQALKDSRAHATVLGTFDFLNAERKARAKVDVLFVNKSVYQNTAFDDWFNATFDVSDAKIPESKKNKRAREEVIAGKNKVELMVTGYNGRLDELYRHFKSISALDSGTLESIGVTKKKVVEALKNKIAGLKNFYWHLAFDQLEEITSRLTRQTRERLCERFDGLVTADFTAENIYALLVWVCKNASAYYDEQLIKLYKDLSAFENVSPFKSNQKVFDKEYWGRCRIEERTKYCLCNRIITRHLSFRSRYFWENKIDEHTSAGVVDDFCAIANNLGFLADKKETPTEYGKKYYVYLPDGKPLMEFKVFANGNTHIKLNPDFALAMSVEASRLLGWIRDKSDIEKEFPNESVKKAKQFFGVQYVAGNNAPLLEEFNNR